jgi:hypothetical protein
MPAAPAVRVLCVSIVLIACGRERRRERPALRLLELDGAGRCRAVDRQGAAVGGGLLPGALAVPGLIVLVIEEASGRRRHVWLPDDALRDDDQRTLRLRLRVAA